MGNTSTLSIFSVTLFLLLFITNGDPYEYLLLVQQWEPAVCSELNINCVVQPIERFTVRGLWHGNISNGQGVLNCAGSPFDITKLAPIINELIAVWPDVINYRDDVYWEDEWNLHGKCSEGIFNQLDYFSTGYQKFEAINILKILNNAGFFPNNQALNTNTVAIAIANTIGKSPALRCTMKKGEASNVRQLAEVILCYDKHALVFIDCPHGLNVCPPDLLFTA